MFMKIQNGRKRGKPLHPSTRIRLLLKIHKITEMPQRLASFRQQLVTRLLFSSSTIHGTSKLSNIILDTRIPTITTTPWDIMELHTHQISMVYLKDHIQELQLLMGSLLLCLEWKTRPQTTPNHSLPHLLPPSLPRAQPPQTTPLLPHPNLSPHLPILSMPSRLHKTLTAAATACHTHPVTPTKCRCTVTPRADQATARASKRRTPTSLPRIIPSSSCRISTPGWVGERRIKTKNKDSNSGTA